MLSEAYDMYHDRLDKSNANLEDQPDEIMDGDGYRYCGVTYKGVHAEGYLDKNTGVFYLNEELDKLRNNLDTNGVK
ncbi:hypothetical protein IT400_02425 [Candidatus Nomurabacteria bacterium]|nr:hypothetical protein [Candidatus Nomurabacteria bacterium]